MTARALQAAAELRERGYAVFEGARSPDDVRRIRDSLATRYAALGSPRTFARPPLEPGPDVEISAVGLVFHQLGKHCGEVAACLLDPEVVASARALLGDDMHLEYTAGIVNDGSRPFFRWHMHVGGVDNEVYRKQQLFPSFTRSERVTMLLYLDDLTRESGELLVFPRRVEDPTRPPFDPAKEHWHGQVALACRSGTAVLLEQNTWHAARPKESSGLRMFVACYFTASYAQRTSWRDHSWRPFAHDSALLRSLL
ncbi:phytanoyl-CoA dioxygenase family protein [Paraliomyxa miuraensis]|uniref:phytanoyl-CoA dioxygenase family protein n=1 Tax=Paraliomyxa miuraensis TaxID=376150 RepID=UPI00225732F6|nr:phytanoyl-CoA dioxygenase family protein [Paraliomyxa miuraensis]MCX4243661.1 phytanoyl-CoA dioxygenase family protein [Paraliomyxa miuraensis]